MQCGVAAEPRTWASMRSVKWGRSLSGAKASAMRRGPYEDIMDSYPQYTVRGLDQALTRLLIQRWPVKEVFSQHGRMGTARDTPGNTLQPMS